MKYLVILLLLSGCGRMSYEEVQDAEAYCASHKLTPKRLANIRGDVGQVRCEDQDGTNYIPRTVK